jgi:hypothetical protein
MSVVAQEPREKSTRRNPVATFLSDLLEDVLQKPLQAAKFAKHDMFREHINAMSISYFALIVLLIAISVPVLVYAVSRLVPY